MSAFNVQKKLKELGVLSRSMRWSKDLRSLTEMIQSGKTPQDFFFEFWCYLCAVRTVQQEIGAVKLVVPNGQTLAIWPLKPGAAVNFSYFSFTADNIDFGVYPGVEFGYKGIASTFAPDISIRSAIKQAVQPEIYAVWDAKYRSNPDKGISRSEVYAFNTARTLLAISYSAQLKQALDDITHMPCFRACGLITNGGFSAEHNDTLVALGLFETARFGTGSEATRP